jgi:CheY-like chemotaxis protein
MNEIKRILIIEDDPNNRELEKTLLKRGGYSILEAEDAERGITIAEDEQPDVILLDWQLPKMDGLQAIQVLKNNPRTKDIPVIFVTASATEEQVKLFKASSACGYITKPINTRTFVEQVIEFTRNAELTGT